MKYTEWRDKANAWLLKESEGPAWLDKFFEWRDRHISEIVEITVAVVIWGIIAIIIAIVRQGK